MILESAFTFAFPLLYVYAVKSQFAKQRPNDLHFRVAKFEILQSSLLYIQQIAPFWTT